MRHGVVVLISVILLSSILASISFADEIRVKRDEVLIVENSRCSLREAIVNANDDAETHPDCDAGNGADTLVLESSENNPALYELPDGPAAFDADGSNGLPSITTEITIEGNYATIERSQFLPCLLNSIRTADEFRIFHVSSTGDLTINHAKIENGCADGVGDADGGAIVVKNGAVELYHSELRGNRAQADGGAVDLDGGSLAIKHSTLRNNFTLNRGGGVRADNETNPVSVGVEDSIFFSNDAGVSGGGLQLQGATGFMANTTIHENESVVGGGIEIDGTTSFGIGSTNIFENFASQDGGGVSVLDGFVILEGSSIYENIANNEGGGVAAQMTANIFSSMLNISDNSASRGAGIANQGTLTMLNSTITENHAMTDGGGFWNSTGTAELSFVTIVKNQADLMGGGIAIDSGTFDIKNSIVAENMVNDCFNSTGAFTALGNNFDTDGTCQALDALFIQVTPEELKLANPAQNGGDNDTETIALLPGSIAIDAITDCTDGDGIEIISDQRNRQRAFPWEGICDVGAYEFSYQLIDSEVRGSVGFMINAKCGSMEETFTIDTTEFREIDFYETEVEIHFPQSRNFRDPENPPMADVVQIFSLIEPTGFLMPGARTLPISSQVTNGQIIRNNCDGIESFPTDTFQNNFVSEVLYERLSDVQYFSGVLSLETNERNLRVYATTIKRQIRCSDDGITRICNEHSVIRDRQEIGSQRINKSFDETFALSVEINTRLLANGRALAFFAQSTQVNELNVEVFGLNGRNLYSATSASNSLVWRMIDNRGRPVANGVYLYVVTARDSAGRTVKSDVKKLVVMR